MNENNLRKTSYATEQTDSTQFVNKFITRIKLGSFSEKTINYIGKTDIQLDL